MADHEKRRPMSESELSAAYAHASHQFSVCHGWRELLALAEDFKALNGYKDAAQMQMKCVKGASAAAYREITASLEGRANITADEYREAARVMNAIQDYSDARELMRVYTIKANVLTYDAAIDILADSEATTEDYGNAVDMLRSIKGFRDSRDLLDRHEKHYFDKMYREALDLMEHGRVYTEFVEAAEMFEKIAVYSDARDQAAACRKKAHQLRPKEKKKAKPAKAVASGDSVARVKPEKASKAADKRPSEIVRTKKAPRVKDETVNGVAEVWRDIDKRKFAVFLAWMVLFIAALVFSVQLNKITLPLIVANTDLIRMLCVILAVVSAVMGGRAFMQMLTVSMRKKLAKAALAFAKKLAAPLAKVVTKLLSSIGIDITGRRRLNGRDEKSIIHDNIETVKKKKKRLKNELKWVEQTSNSARVRFIFIDYMIRHIREGYRLRHAMTATEISRDLAVEPEEQELFRVYQMARYSGGRAEEEITSEMVNELKMINQRKN